MDEPVWATADSITDFRQRDPVEGAPATERTVIKVLRDQDALVIGVRAYDREPAKIRASQLRRDADLSSDDNITILIDSFHDHRNAFLFQTNANGAMWDGQKVGWQDVNADWNGIWDVKASRDDQGWTAVLRIPFQTLRFTSSSNAVFGINVRRFIRRKNEEDLWRAWRRSEGLDQLLPEGHLVGLQGASRGRDIELFPYVLADARQGIADTLGNRMTGPGVDGKAGIDGKLAVTPTLTADFSLNTDFAQVEIDSQVINLTRLPTFFPEKREFFLESSGIFDFGSTQQAQLFYSRTIGLTDSGQVVPMYGGARLYGRAGPWTIGLLDARTGGIAEANNAVVRVKHDVLDRSYIGAMATAVTGPSVHGTASAGGVDGEFPLVIGSQNIVPSFWVAGTQTPDTAGIRKAWRLGLDFPNDLFDNYVSIEQVDSGFAPTLGFIDRSGVWFTRGHIDFMPRPHFLGLRQLDLQLPAWSIYANENGFLTHGRDWQTAWIEWRPLGGTFQNGDRFEVNFQRQMDAPTEVFTIVRGVNILPGRYWWSRTELQYITSFERPVSVFSLVSFGQFYDGKSTVTALDLIWRSGGHFILGAGESRTEAWISAGHFVALQATGRLQYAFTTRADLLGFLQVDNVLHRLDTNIRFHWIPIIGDDVYVVWNSGYSIDPLARFEFPNVRAINRPLNGIFTVKFVHRIAP
jgi:hypothetical protein